MNKCLGIFAATLILLAGNAWAQVSGAVQIYTVPAGIAYTVDGEFYRAPSTAVWPAGSKHVLSVNPVQVGLNAKTRYAFGSWQYPGGNLPGATVTVTADPAIKEFFATFTVQHAVSLNFSDCPPDIPCQSPGTIFVNGAAYTNDADIYVAAGSVANLVASPAPGYVFTGWDPGVNQTITGFANNVLVVAPTVVRPRFQLARRINFETVPPELDLFADRARVPTPSTLEWAYGTTHTVGVPSPQIARNGSQWVFLKWSDGGADSHAYTVPDGGGPVTLTATFVPGTGTELRTSPPGLLLKIDGRDNWPGYYFTWPAGEVHRIEAPEQQTDANGGLWSFASWSNGGARVQDYVAAEGPTGAVRLVATYTPVGHVVVNSAVAGLTVKIDGAECPIPCDVRRPVGTVVRMTAPASIPIGDHTRGDFDGWPGSGSIAPDWTVKLGPEPLSPYLTYHKMNRLIAASDPVDAASWRMQPASADGFYDAHATVIVSVTALPGFRFRGWGGDANGAAAMASVAMDTPRLVQALFDRVPYVAPAGVANAAGATPEKAVAPGSIVSIFGASFAPGVIVGPETPLTQALGGVTVKIGDRILPLFFVSPSQINVQLPDDTAVGDQRLIVSSLGLPDVQATFTTVRSAPGLFQDEQSFALATHQDGSAITVDSPAKTGELLTLYGTGFGPAESPRPFGFAPPSASPIVDSATVLVDDVPVAAASASAVAGRIGVDAVQFRMIEGVSVKSSVRVRLNGKESNTVLVPVQ